MVRSSSGTRIIIALAGLLAVLGCVYAFRWRRDRRQNVVTLEHVGILYRALARHWEEHGSLPVSEKGPEYALYALRPYCEEIPVYYAGTADPLREGAESKIITSSGWQALGRHIFDQPYTRLDNGEATWDEAEMRVLNIDFDYLNEDIILDRDRPVAAVIAEKEASSPGGRWVAFTNGARLWVSKRNPHYHSVLGRSKEELSAAEPRPVRAPIGVRGERHVWNRKWQMARLQSTLLFYAMDHGTLPYSEKGGDHAMYALKPYVPDAQFFDGVYGVLENGVAYWDDEEKKLVNGDLLYLNEPLPFFEDEKRESIDPELRTTILFADKEGVWPGVKWVSTARSQWTFRLREGDPRYEDPFQQQGQ